MPNVTALRTIRIAERANLLWLEVETDEGLTGLGESFRGSQAVEAVIHEHVAPYLLGKDARHIEAISRHLVNPYVGFHSASAEVRAASAVDMALWDLTGQRHGVPVYVALGGGRRERRFARARRWASSCLIATCWPVTRSMSSCSTRRGVED